MGFWDKFKFRGERRDAPKQEQISDVVSNLILKLHSLPDSFDPNDLLRLMKSINPTEVLSLQKLLQGVTVNQQFVEATKVERERLITSVENYCSQNYPYSDPIENSSDSPLWQRLSGVLFRAAENLSGQKLPMKSDVSLAETAVNIPKLPAATDFEDSKDTLPGVDPLEVTHQAAEIIAPSFELPRDTRYEKESGPTLHFEQVRNGKKVQYKDGPIVSGAGYEFTQGSRNFPRDILNRCYPYDIGLGTDDRFVWEGYPWKEQGGGIVHKIVESSDGKKYHVCGRVIARSEGGTAMPTLRPYVESHYIVIPDADWSISAIPYLINVLNCEPRVANTPGIVEPIELKSDAVLDQPLPAQWLDSVEDFVVRIAGGVTTQTQNRNETVGDFLNKIFYVAVALPKEKAKELTFGSGVWQAADDFNLVNVARAVSPTGSRKINGEWKNTNLAQLEKGKKYIAELRGLIQRENCQTFRDVMNAIEKAELDY